MSDKEKKTAVTEEDIDVTAEAQEKDSGKPDNGSEEGADKPEKPKSKKESKKKNKYKEELKALKEKYVRLAAEYDNFRKRSSREIQSILRTANENIVKDMLPIIDNLDLATEHREKTTTLEEYVKGIALIEDQLREILAQAGLKHIEAVGKPFDPNLHEAILQMESDEYDPGIVMNETQKGYLFADKVIRHSKVVVSK
jgi:molecular chaperone GrpE